MPHTPTPRIAQPALAAIAHAEAERALELQQRQVAELRQRTGPLVAAAALSGTFSLGALGTSARGPLVVLATAAMCVTLLCGVYVLYPHRLVFVLDHERAIAAANTTEPRIAAVHLLLTRSIWDLFVRNAYVIARMERCFAVATVVLAIQIGLWFIAIAVR